MRKIDSPFAVSLESMYEDETTIFLVMDLHTGGTLLSLLSDGEPMPEYAAKVYMKTLLSALDVLHASNIAHRDVKLENVLVSNGCSVLSDFGLSRKLRRNKVAT
jgi:serine/threonine protein kinase